MTATSTFNPLHSRHPIHPIHVPCSQHTPLSPTTHLSKNSSRPTIGISRSPHNLSSCCCIRSGSPPARSCPDFIPDLVLFRLIRRVFFPGSEPTSLPPAPPPLPPMPSSSSVITLPGEPSFRPSFHPSSPSLGVKGGDGEGGGRGRGFDQGAFKGLMPLPIGVFFTTVAGTNVRCFPSTRSARVRR